MRGIVKEGGGTLKKHKDMRGGLEKNTSTKEGVPRKKCKIVRFPPLPPPPPPLGINNDRSLNRLCTVNSFGGYFCGGSFVLCLGDLSFVLLAPYVYFIFLVRFR